MCIRDSNNNLNKKLKRLELVFFFNMYCFVNVLLYEENVDYFYIKYVKMKRNQIDVSDKFRTKQFQLNYTKFTNCVSQIPFAFQLLLYTCNT